MWEAIKVGTWILMGAVFLALLSIPIVRVVRRVGLLRYELQEARAQAQRKGIAWHGPGKDGRLGLMYNAATGAWTDADTGERWKDTGEERPPDPSKSETTLKQRALAAAGGARPSRRETSPTLQPPARMLDNGQWMGRGARPTPPDRVPDGPGPGEVRV